jgi:hypothetical protein
MKSRYRASEQRVAARDRMNFYYPPRPKGTQTIAFRRHYRRIADSREFYRKNDGKTTEKRRKNVLRF